MRRGSTWLCRMAGILGKCRAQDSAFYFLSSVSGLCDRMQGLSRFHGVY